MDGKLWIPALALWASACGPGLVRAPAPSFSAARSAGLSRPIQVEALVPASEIVGTLYDGAARMPQKNYKVAGLKGVMQARIEAAARAFAIPVQNGAELTLVASFPMIEAASHGMFASGNGQIVIQGSGVLKDRSGVTLYEAPISASVPNESNETEALFPVLDGAIGAWFSNLSDRVASDHMLAGTLNGTRTSSSATPQLVSTAATSAIVSRPPPPAGPEPDHERAASARSKRVGRVLLSPIMGALFQGAFGVGALVLANTVCNGEPDISFDFNDEGCGIAFSLGSVGVSLFVVPIGVAWSSSWLDGMASYSWALLGALFGLLAPFSTGPAFQVDFATGIYFGQLFMPLASMLMYEFRSYMVEGEALTHSGLAISPTLSPVYAYGQLDGFALGVSIGNF